MVCKKTFWPVLTGLRGKPQRRGRERHRQDAVAACAREIMAELRTWTGTASDFLRAASALIRDVGSLRSTEWPRSPRPLATRLRRAQTFLRTPGIEMAFSGEGRAGNCIIRRGCRKFTLQYRRRPLGQQGLTCGDPCRATTRAHGRRRC